MIKSYGKIFIALVLLFVSGCDTRYGDRCLETVQKITAENQLTPYVFQTKKHKIFALLGPQRQAMTAKKEPMDVHVYIEGDGLAWASRFHISLDPTPVEPTGLTLAMADQTSAAKVYLGRPGHYIEDNRLGLYSWTFARFSTETIETYDDIIDQLHQLYPKAQISLFGYSGGALVALLTAAKRSQEGKHDIVRVVTFAGVLDHEAWSECHDSSPLTFSLNSLAYLEPLREIPQCHYSGLKDTIVPLKVSKSYMRYFQGNPNIQLVQVPNVDHWHGWEKFWSRESLTLKDGSCLENATSSGAQAKASKN
jgi:predicted esterase